MGKALLIPRNVFHDSPYSDHNKGWPWTLPAMIRIEHLTPWITEEWNCTFKELSPPFDDFTFEIRGSKTGKDGVGRASEDFTSKSKRVI
jgi:hypothetical protein